MLPPVRPFPGAERLPATRPWAGLVRFGRRLLKLGVVVGVLGFLAYRYFFYVDLPSGCNVTIAPAFTEFSNTAIKRAIVVLREAMPDEYRKFCANVSHIDPNFACGGFEGGCYRSTQKRTIVVSTSQRSLAWTAAVLAHETCHAIQDQEGRGFDENECYAAGDRVLQTVVQF